MKKRDIIIALSAAVIIAALLSPFASSWPDGLEKVAEKLGFIEKAEVEPAIHSPLPDYGVPGMSNEKISTAVAGILGTLAVFGITFGTASIIRRRKHK